MVNSQGQAIRRVKRLSSVSSLAFGSATIINSLRLKKNLKYLDDLNNLNTSNKITVDSTGGETRNHHDLLGLLSNIRETLPGVEVSNDKEGSAIGEVEENYVGESNFNEEFRLDWTLITRLNVSVNRESFKKAVMFAIGNDLEVVDIVPSSLGVERAVSFLNTVTLNKFQFDPLTLGRGANCALLVKNELLNRSGIEKHCDLSGFEIVKATQRLKCCAPFSMGFIVGDVCLSQISSFRDPDEERAINENMAVLPVLLRRVKFMSIIFGIFSPLALLFRIFANEIQPRFIFKGSNVQPFDLRQNSFSRLWRELKFSVFYDYKELVRDDLAASLRESYSHLLKDNDGKLFESKSGFCPWCNSVDIGKLITSKDNIQHKPGSFNLDKCFACGHIFQNPRLTTVGLNFYYKDFYDGLGEDQIERVFGSLGSHYKRRVSMVMKHIKPVRWLDVGTGHGHFCIYAKTLLKATTFDGLDMSDSVIDAKQRGWVDAAYQGLFPKVADEIVGKYDVISMHHYLEHCIDPKMEIRSAYKVLKKNGYFLIEVPNPKSKFGSLLKQYWMPWFQPQHLNLISLNNMKVELEKNGFEVVATEVSQAHQPAELFFALMFVLDSLVPNPKLPWINDIRVSRKILRILLIGAASLPLAVAAGIDRVVPLFLKGENWSNAYRILAKKMG